MNWARRNFRNSNLNHSRVIYWQRTNNNRTRNMKRNFMWFEIDYGKYLYPILEKMFFLTTKNSYEANDNIYGIKKKSNRKIEKKKISSKCSSVDGQIMHSKSIRIMQLICGHMNVFIDLLWFNASWNLHCAIFEVFSNSIWCMNAFVRICERSNLSSNAAIIVS